MTIINSLNYDAKFILGKLEDLFIGCSKIEALRDNSTIQISNVHFTFASWKCMY